MNRELREKVRKIHNRYYCNSDIPDEAYDELITLILDEVVDIVEPVIERSPEIIMNTIDNLRGSDERE